MLLWQEGLNRRMCEKSLLQGEEKELSVSYQSENKQGITAGGSRFRRTRWGKWREQQDTETTELFLEVTESPFSEVTGQEPTA